MGWGRKQNACETRPSMKALSDGEVGGGVVEGTYQAVGEVGTQKDS